MGGDRELPVSDMRQPRHTSDCLFNDSGTCQWNANNVGGDCLEMWTGSGVQAQNLATTSHLASGNPLPPGKVFFGKRWKQRHQLVSRCSNMCAKGDFAHCDHSIALHGNVYCMRAFSCKGSPHIPGEGSPLEEDSTLGTCAKFPGTGTCAHNLQAKWLWKFKGHFQAPAYSFVN